MRGGVPTSIENKKRKEGENRSSVKEYFDTAEGRGWKHKKRTKVTNIR